MACILKSNPQFQSLEKTFGEDLAEAIVIGYTNNSTNAKAVKAKREGDLYYPTALEFREHIKDYRNNTLTYFNNAFNSNPYLSKEAIAKLLPSIISKKDGVYYITKGFRSDDLPGVKKRKIQDFFQKNHDAVKGLESAYGDIFKVKPTRNKYTHVVEITPRTEEFNAVLFNREKGFKSFDNEYSTGVLKQLVEKLSENTGVTSNFITSEQARELTKDTANPWGGENAFYFNGETYFLKGQFTSKDVLHEFAHPIISSLRKSNNSLYTKLYNDLLITPEGQEIFDEVTSQYSDYSQEHIKDEILVKYMERAAHNELKSKEAKSLLSKILFAIKQALRKLFNSKVKVDKLNPNTTLNDLAKMLVNEEFVLPENISEQDMVQYNRDTKEYEDALTKLDKADVQTLINLMYKFSKSQTFKVKSNSYLKGVRDVLADDSGRGGLQAITNELKDYQNTEKKFNDAVDSDYRLTALSKTLVQNILSTSRIAEHITEISNTNKKSDDDAASMIHYSHLLNNFKEFTEIVEALFNKIDSKTKKPIIPLDHPLRQLISENHGLVNYSQNKISDLKSEMSDDIVYDIFKDSGFIERQEKHFEAELAKAKTPKQQAEVLKRKEEQLVTPEKIKALFDGSVEDAKYFSSAITGWGFSSDLLYTGTSKLINDTVAKVVAKAHNRHNEFSFKFNPLVKKAGLNPKNINEFFNEFSFTDTVGAYDTDDAGNDIIKKTEVYSLINRFKDYRFEREDRKFRLEQLKEDAISSGEYEEYNQAVEDFEQFKKDYFHREYTDEVYKPMDELTSTVTGKEALDERNKVLGDIQELQQALDLKSFRTEEDDALLEEAWNTYSGLFSEVDLYGNKKTDEELEKVQLLKKYRDANSKYRERVLNNKAFTAAYETHSEKIINTGLIKDTVAYNKAMKEWVDNNTQVSIKDEYYETLSGLFNEIKKITDKVDDKGFGERQKKVRDRMRELTSQYKDVDRVVNGDSIPHDVLQEIKSLEEKLIELKKEQSEIVGLTEEEQSKFDYYMLAKKSNFTLTPEEREELLNLQQKQRNGLSVADNARLKGLYAQVGELNNKEVTDYYVQSMRKHLVNASPEHSIPELTKKSLDELMENKALLEKLFEENATFEGWFKQNHILKKVYDPTLFSYIEKWVPTSAWMSTKPSDIKWYGSTPIYDNQGQVIDIINRVPSGRFYYSRVKNQYRTKKIVGETVDSNGNFLPKTLEEGAKDSRFLNEKYHDLKDKTDAKSKAKFELLNLISDYHLESQDGVSGGSKLGFDIPRFRVKASEVLKGGKVAGKVQNKWSQLKESVSTEFKKADDDFEDGFNPDSENDLTLVRMFDSGDEKIPVRGTYKIDLENTSKDFIRSIMDYGDSALRHTEMKRIQPKIKVILDTLEKNKSLKGVDPAKGIFSNRKNSNIDHRLKLIQSKYEKEILGKSLFEADNKHKTIAKTINSTFGRSVKAYLSDLPSALKDKFSDTYQNMLEAVGGEYYNPLNYKNGWSIASKASSKFTFGMDSYNSGPKDKYIQMAGIFDAVPDYFLDKDSQSFSRSAKKDITDEIGPMVFLAARERLQMHSSLTTFFSYMDSVKVPQTINGKTKTIRYHQAWEVKDGVLTLKEGIDSKYAPGGTEFIFHTNRARHVGNKLRGAFAKIDSPEFERSLIFKTLTHMKRWMAGMMLNRYGYSTRKGYLSPLLGKAEGRFSALGEEMDMGFYISSVNSVARIVRTLIADGKLAHINKKEKAALIKFVVESSLVLGLFRYLIVEALLGYDSTDDDRFKKMRERSGHLYIPGLTETNKRGEEFDLMGFVHNNMINVALGTENEMDAFIIGGGLGQTISGTIDKSIAAGPIMNLIESGGLAIDAAIGDKKAFYKKEVGAFTYTQAGDPKFINRLLKNFGITGEMLDPSTRAKRMSPYLDR